MPSSNLPTPEGIHRSVERDGCGCPPWVIRCVHWEGQILLLQDGSTAEASPCCNGVRPAPVWWIGAIAGDWSACEVCGDASYFARQKVFALPAFIDFDAALAEFRRREALLLGREPDDA